MKARAKKKPAELRRIKVVIPFDPHGAMVSAVEATARRDWVRHWDERLAQFRVSSHAAGDMLAYTDGNLYDTARAAEAIIDRLLIEIRNVQLKCRKGTWKPAGE